MKDKDKYNGVRFVYVRDGDAVRDVTAAYRFNDAERRIEFATAECSERDQFCKKIGRSISYARLTNGYKVRTIPYAEVCDEGETSPKYSLISGAVVAAVAGDMWPEDCEVCPW